MESISMKLLLILSLALTLTACGGSNSTSSNTGANSTAPINAYTPTVTSLSQMKLVDAQGVPLSNAEISITPKESTVPMGILINNTEFSNLSTDPKGNLTLNNLQPGTYTLKITVQGITVSSEIIIDANNSSASTTVAAPIIIDGANIISLQDVEGKNKGIFASISGVIFTTTGPLVGAEVSLSGGAETMVRLPQMSLTKMDITYLLLTCLLIS